jgi:hypothetical protein
VSKYKIPSLQVYGSGLRVDEEFQGDEGFTREFSHRWLPAVMLGPHVFHVCMMITRC